jgi:Protein HRI1
LTSNMKSVSAGGVPAELRGVWRRRSIRVGTNAAEEPYDVVWIQGDPGFADLRLPRSESNELAVRCFAGTAAWDGQRLTWTHDIDIDPSRRDQPDVGMIEVSSDVLLERGYTIAPDGGAVEYVEEYLRLSEPGDAVAIVAYRHADGSLRGIRAEAGRHRLTVVDDRPVGGHLTAIYEEHADGRWSARLRFGPEPLSPK